MMAASQPVSWADRSMSLHDMFQLADKQFTEQQIWAVIHQCAVALQDVVDQEDNLKAVACPFTLCFTGSGNVEIISPKSNVDVADYLPPELEDGQPAHARDNVEGTLVFSLGVTVYTDVVAFKNAERELSDELSGLLSEMVDEEPDDRPSLKDLVSRCEEIAGSQDILRNELSLLVREIFKLQILVAKLEEYVGEKDVSPDADSEAVVERRSLWKNVVKAINPDTLAKLKNAQDRQLNPLSVTLTPREKLLKDIQSSPKSKLAAVKRMSTAPVLGSRDNIEGGPLTAAKTISDVQVRPSQIKITANPILKDFGDLGARNRALEPPGTPGKQGMLQRAHSRRVQGFTPGGGVRRTSDTEVDARMKDASQSRRERPISSGALIVPHAATVSATSLQRGSTESIANDAHYTSIIARASDTDLYAHTRPDMRISVNTMNPESNTSLNRVNLHGSQEVGVTMLHGSPGNSPKPVRTPKFLRSPKNDDTSPIAFANMSMENVVLRDAQRVSDAELDTSQSYLSGVSTPQSNNSPAMSPTVSRYAPSSPEPPSAVPPVLRTRIQTDSDLSKPVTAPLSPLASRARSGDSGMTSKAFSDSFSTSMERLGSITVGDPKGGKNPQITLDEAKIMAQNISKAYLEDLDEKKRLLVKDGRSCRVCSKGFAGNFLGFGGRKSKECHLCNYQACADTCVQHPQLGSHGAAPVCNACYSDVLNRTIKTVVK